MMVLSTLFDIHKPWRIFINWLIVTIPLLLQLDETLFGKIAEYLNIFGKAYEDTSLCIFVDTTYLMLSFVVNLSLLIIIVSSLPFTSGFHLDKRLIVISVSCNIKQAASFLRHIYFVLQ